MTTEEKARAYDEAFERAKKLHDSYNLMHISVDEIEQIFPELAESEDERIRKFLVDFFASYKIGDVATKLNGVRIDDILAYLEKQKEKPKSADSIPSDCVSDAKCEDRWHKVGDSLPDNGRLVLAQDCLGNILLARYDGEGNWEVSVYDKDDYYCRNTITKWCEIPSEKQKEQKPAEWSEEDENMRESAIALIRKWTNYSGENVGDSIKVISWLQWLPLLAHQH